MPQFAANLSFLYPERPLTERFAAAAADGFRAVELLFPYALPKTELAQRLTDQGLKQVLFNTAQGDFDGGERGIACLPGREDEFRRAITEQALPYAMALRCPRVHVMAGVVPEAADPARLRDTYVANLAWAAAQAASVGVALCIEPINPRDMPGYFLNRQAQAHAIVQAVGAANLQVQMDLYHCQIVEGDLASRLKAWLPGGRVGHLQIAGVPDRHEPDAGEVRYEFLFDLIDALGYGGHIGCEYRPRGDTSAGLGWFQPYRSAQR
ncbi:MAG: hydroxypyruvate isomerase family protein [Rubrivivax sp.]|nr:hydroxypyruvate isomerase family protein [Rubrivivax sp.]